MAVRFGFEALARTCIQIVWLWVAPALLIGGCARISQPVVSPAAPVLFPAPPERARVQYLGSISSASDLPQRSGGFAGFVLGAPEDSYPLVKPIAALLADENLYVCDTVLNTVVVYDMLKGGAHRLAGDQGIGKIRQPNNMALDSEGRLYVADKLRGAVLVYGKDEIFLHAWGRPGKVAPVAVAVGADALYVCDIQDHEVEVWNRATGDLVRTIGGKGHESGLFTLPTHLALDKAGNLYVSDTGNFRVQMFSPDGKFLQQFGRPGTSPGCLAWPKGVAIDGMGRLYVADSRFANVQIFDKTGQLLLFFGGPSEDAGNLHLPAGVEATPWPSIPWLDRRLAEGFEPAYLVIVVNQWREHMIDFFAVAREETGQL